MKVTMANQENNMVATRNIETQVRQIAKQLAEGQSVQFSANTKTNPKENCNTISIERGRITGERDVNNVVTEKEGKNDTKGEKGE